MEKKAYVLDTSAILENPDVLVSLGDNLVVIPEVVLEELDSMKDRKDEKGYASREAIRLLDSLIESGRAREESLHEGLSTPGNGTLKVELNHADMQTPGTWVNAPNDNRILQVCLAYAKTCPTVLISSDRMLKIKAEALGIRCEAYKGKRVETYDKQYRGIREISVPKRFIEAMYERKEMDPEQIGDVLGKEPLVLNEFVVLVPSDGPGAGCASLWNGKSLVLLDGLDGYCPSGVQPRNMKQKLMAYALCRPASEVPLVILKGPAGTAKTLFALAVGLDGVRQSGEKPVYRKILVCRTNVSMDEDLGYLPGDEKTKLAPFMRPIRDNLEVILSAKRKNGKTDGPKKLDDYVDEFFTSKMIDVEAVGFLRGRSITHQYVIVEEAQNATPKQIMSIITRMGEGTKIVLCGDPQQIDHPYLDERNNGISVASEVMKGSPYCMQITLTEKDCVRSDLAKDAVARFNGKR